MYTIVMVERTAVVHIHVNRGNDVCTIVIVERNVVDHSHVNMGTTCVYYWYG